MRTKLEKEAQLRKLDYYNSLAPAKTPQQKYRIEEQEHKKRLERRKIEAEKSMKRVRSQERRIFMNSIKEWKLIKDLTEDEKEKEQLWGEEFAI